jgi:hypothetical protein
MNAIREVIAQIELLGGVAGGRASEMAPISTTGLGPDAKPSLAWDGRRASIASLKLGGVKCSPFVLEFLRLCFSLARRPLRWPTLRSSEENISLI